MTASTLTRGGVLGDGNRLVWLLGLCILAMMSIHVRTVFQGELPGIDDLMRLQQVRDLMAGQSWFNVDQARLLTPEGGEMHWSRLPDIFLAGLIVISRPFLGQAGAEAFAAGVWPLILLAAALVLLSTIMQRLGLSRSGQVFGLLIFATSTAIYNFWPGRIDHHGFVVVLVLAGLAALLSPQFSARSGAVLAFCVPAALSVAIEGLPYAAGLIAIMGLFWVVRGHLEGVRLTAFGLWLAAFATGFYLLDAPGFGPRRLVCDAYGVSHWSAFVFGGGLLAALGIFGGALDSWQKRLLAGLVAGGATLAVFVGVNPACLGDPYAAVPEQVRIVWLDSVMEARSLSMLLVVEPERVVWVFGFLTVATVATGLMIARAPSHLRLARIGCGLLLALAIIATIYQVRGQSFSHLFGAIGAGWLAGLTFDLWRRRGGVPVLLGFIGVIAVAWPPTWQSLSAPFVPASQVEGELESVSRECIETEQFTRLNDHPPMKVFTPIDLGISIIARTPHAAFAGPYHRNGTGIERVTEIFTGPTETAQTGLHRLGATHLVFCVGLNETDVYSVGWPESFAAALNRGEVPDWLEPEEGRTAERGVLILYRVAPE